MNNKQILDNAPEGATHVDDVDEFWILSDDQNIKSQSYIKGKGFRSLSIDGFSFRSLDDIREIESLREQLKTAKEKNYTLTKTYNNLFDSYQYLEDEMIEIKGQQAQDQGE